MRLLLLSNSTNYQEEYLSWPRPYIQDFLGKQAPKVLFIPYAGVTVSWDDYTDKVSSVFGELGYEVAGIHRQADAVAAVRSAEAIAIGGGNTFRLLELLYSSGILDPIRERVRQGVPLIGWSAGSNVCGPTLCTTNDMPIAEPPSFKALDLIPFQINPHYTEKTIPGHGGESRDQRLLEYLAIHPGIRVAGLPEGSALRVEGTTAQLLGDDMKLFEKDKEVQTIKEGTLLSLELGQL